MRGREISRRSACVLPVVLLAASSAASRSKTHPLFVVLRSKNKNALHYAVHLDNAGNLRLKEPLFAYWIMHAEDGHREGLTWPEREFAYGWRFSSSVTREGFRFRLQAFGARELVVRRSDAHGYRAFVPISGKDAVLERIFVKSDNHGLTPKVHYVELFGRHARTHAALRERIDG